MNNPKTLLDLPPPTNEIWEGSRVKAPFWITGEAGGPYRPILEIWAELRSDLIVALQLVRQLPPPQASLRFLWQAMTAPKVGPPRRPSCLRVVDKSLADLMRQKLAGAGITVELVERSPLIDRIVAEMEKSIGGRGSRSMPALTTLRGVTPERAGALYQAAAHCYQQAPWRVVSDEIPLEITCPDFSRRPVYLTVMGNAGVEFGLMLIFSRKELQRLRATADEFELAQAPMRCVTLSFAGPTYLAIVDHDAIERHHWPVAGPRAFPHVFQIMPGRRPLIQPPTLAQVDLLEACLLALPPVVAGRQTAFRAGRPFVENVPVETFHGTWQLQMSWPPRNW